MKEKESHYLGALLHDIGKFTFRSMKTTKGSDHETLGEALVKDRFMQHNVFKNDSSIMNVVASGIKRQLKGIKKADISVARERENQESSKTRRPLMSVLQFVEIQKKLNKEKTYWYHPKPIDLSADMPEVENVPSLQWIPDDSKMIAEHKESYDKFLKEISKLAYINDYRAYIKTFHYLLHKYTAKVSSASYKSVPDISLYDHSRIVAGLSLCFNEADSDNEVILLSGDFSGIQSFIYRDIYESERAAKQLRGRSFYVRLLSDAIVEYIIEELGVYDGNVFYASGGTFMLLLPNNKVIRDKLKTLEKSINSNLYKEFQTNLQVVLAYKDFNRRELMTGFEIAMNEIREILTLNKNKKSLSILPDIMGESIDYKSDKYDEIFKNVGEKIPRNDYLLEIVCKPNENLYTSEKLYKDNLIEFFEYNRVYALTQKDEIENLLKKLNKTAVERIIIYSYRDTEIYNITSLLQDFEIEFGAGFKFIGSSIPMTENNIPKSFEEIAKKNDGDKEKYSLLGVLKMDVDNLGAIFSIGLKGMQSENDDIGKMSVSRYANLSREFEHYFSGSVNKIAEEKNIYLVYSGGDDLFAVGFWQDLIEFASQVRNDFMKFACNNENIGISAGIYFMKENFPIARASQYAGNLEEKAKLRPNKNSISIFGVEVKWNELREYLKIAKEINKLVELDKYSKSFVYSLLTMTKKVFDRDGNFNADNMNRLISKMYYKFARNKYDSNFLDDDKNKSKFEYTIADYFLNSKDEERKNWYKNFVIPASYVILNNRTS